MSATAASNDSFREEFQTNYLVKDEPQCMKDRPVLDGKSPALTPSESKEATDDLVKKTF